MTKANTGTYNIYTHTPLICIIQRIHTGDIILKSNEINDSKNNIKWYMRASTSK